MRLSSLSNAMLTDGATGNMLEDVVEHTPSE